MGLVTASAFATGAFASRKATSTAIDGGIPRFKVGYITLAATTEVGNLASVDVYKEWGMTKVMVVRFYTHSTTDSVIYEFPLVTTAVTGTTLTVTVPAGADSKKRFIVVYGI